MDAASIPLWLLLIFKGPHADLPKMAFIPDTTQFTICALAEKPQRMCCLVVTRGNAIFGCQTPEQYGTEAFDLFVPARVPHVVNNKARVKTAEKE